MEKEFCANTKLKNESGYINITKIRFPDNEYDHGYSFIFPPFIQCL